MEKVMVRCLIAGVTVLIFIAVLTCQGCGTMYGLGKDISGAAKGMAQAGAEVTRDDKDDQSKRD